LLHQLSVESRALCRSFLIVSLLTCAAFLDDSSENLWEHLRKIKYNILSS
jgi:hypothetical protein